MAINAAAAICPNRIALDDQGTRDFIRRVGTEAVRKRARVCLVRASGDTEIEVRPGVTMTAREGEYIAYVLETGAVWPISSDVVARDFEPLAPVPPARADVGAVAGTQIHHFDRELAGDGEC